MTVPAWRAGQCPKCRSENGVALDGAYRLCLECRHEWNPTTTTGPDVAPVVPVVTVPAPVLSVVPDSPPGSGAADTLVRARSTYLGATVMVHEVDAEGTISEIDDDGQVVVTFGSGYWMACQPDEFTVTDARVIEDETITALATTDMAIAAQCLRAGAATIDDHDNVRHLGLPPDGWLPEDEGVIPVLEHGAAYAIAILATTCGIATDDLVALATRLDEAAEAAKGANHP